MGEERAITLPTLMGNVENLQSKRMEAILHQLRHKRRSLHCAPRTRYTLGPFKRKERLMREISGLAKFGYFCVGLFGGLFGVLAAWFMGKDGWGWSEGGKLFAWFGCLFWLIVWVVMVVTGGIAAFLGMLF